jgi:hypothetical protein
MIIIQSMGFVICAVMCVYFAFAVITDFQWRQSLVNYPFQLALGVVMTSLCGWGAYALYPWGVAS